MEISTDAERRAVPEFWVRWYEGPRDWRRYFKSGFRGTWFHRLRKRRARALAQHASELGVALQNIPSAELQQLGPYWRDFSEALAAKAEPFGKAVAPHPGSLAEALGAYAADFARGLDAVAFGRGLGEATRELLLALGPRSAGFVIALGPRAGRFLALLPQPREALAALGENLLPTLRALGEDLPEFIRELGENQSALLETIGTAGLIEILRGPGAAEILPALQEPDVVFAQLASESSGLLAALGPSIDDFVLKLGPLRGRFLKAFGPQIRAFISKSRRASPIFESIASEAEFWGQTLRSDTASFALALGARSQEFLAAFDEQSRDRFFQALGPSLGTLARWLNLPEEVTRVLRDRPERFVQSLDTSELERFAAEIAPVAEALGRGLGESCAIFGRALGERAHIFARGLGMKTPAFIHGLGGRDLTPQMRGFWATLRRTFIDSMTGNYYATSFLPALSERSQERWFHSLLQASAPRLSPRAVLRCALCHEPFLASEELVRCSVCATLLHRDCLVELAQNRCPNDRSAGQSFIQVRALPAIPSVAAPSSENALADPSTSPAIERFPDAQRPRVAGFAEAPADEPALAWPQATELAQRPPIAPEVAAPNPSPDSGLPFGEPLET